MRANDVDRLVVLSSPAVGDSADRPGPLYGAARLLLGIVMPGVVRDHREQAVDCRETFLVAFETLEMVEHLVLHLDPLLLRGCLTGSFAGGRCAGAVSGGAAVAAALKVAKTVRNAVIVTVFPDSADKYMSERFWTT